MWYMPYVRVRRAVIIYALLALVVSLIAIALRFWPGVVHPGPHQQAVIDALHIDVAMLLSGSAALVAGLATVLGLNLAAENDGHLELAWTKPVSREGYALGVFAVDLAAIAACIGVTIVCAIMVVDICSGHQAIEFDFHHGLLHALAFCGFPLCVYAWITALTASLKRNRGSVAGIFWPLMIAVTALLIVPIPAVHTLAIALNTFNPIDIYSTNSNAAPTTTATYLSGWAISAVLLAAAVFQWRRLEI